MLHSSYGRAMRAGALFVIAAILLALFPVKVEAAQSFTFTTPSGTYASSAGSMATAMKVFPDGATGTDGRPVAGTKILVSGTGFKKQSGTYIQVQFSKATSPTQPQNSQDSSAWTDVTVYSPTGQAGGCYTDSSGNFSNCYVQVPAVAISTTAPYWMQIKDSGSGDWTIGTQGFAVVQPDLAITPASAVIGTGQSQNFVASGGGVSTTLKYQWSIDTPAYGTVSGSGTLNELMTYLAGSTPGTNTITLTDGDGNTVLATIEVTTLPSTTISAVSGSGTYGGTATLTATLSSEGSGVTSKTVSFALNGNSVGTATTDSTGVAILTDVNLSGIDAGTYAGAVTASFAGDSQYTGSGPTAGTLTVAKADQTITFEQPATPATYKSSFSVAPAASSGLSVTVSAAGGCTVSGNTVTMTSGTSDCTLTASQPGDTNYNAASDVVRTVTASKANATISVTGYDVAFDGSEHMATGTATGVNGEDLNGLLNLSGTAHTAVGTYTDTWTFAGNTNYNSDNGSVTNRIRGASQTGFTLTVPDEITYGDTGTATATGGSGTGDVTYSHGDSTGCTVNPDSGVITVTDASGTCAITATKAGDGTYDLATDGPKTVTLAKADATIVVTGYNVTYDAAEHIATGTATGVNGVDLSGLLNLSNTTHTNAGTYTGDTWTFTGNGNYNGDSGTVNSSIAKADATIVVTGYNVTFDGTEHIATGTATGVSGENLSALLNLSGTAHTDVGTYTDTWNFTGNTNYNSDSGSVINRINATGQTGFTLIVPDTITFGDTGTATTTGGSGTGDVTYSTGTSSGCTVDETTGVITVTDASGTCAITATKAGDGTYGPATDGPKTVTLAKAGATIVVTGYTVTYDGAEHIATGTATGVNSVDLSGLLNLSATAHANAGTYTGDTWIFTGNNNYSSANGTVNSSIAKANATITVTGYNVTYDGTEHIATGTATGVSGEDLGSLLDLSDTAHTAVGTYTDAWTFVGNTNYNSDSGSVTSSIVASGQTGFTLTVPGSITFGGTGTATASGGSGTGDVTYSAGASTGCTVDETTGAITVTNASGTCAITATKAADDNYEAVTDGPKAITLNKANATIAVTGYSVTYDGNSHIATGTATGVHDEDLSALLDLSGTTHTNAGTYTDDAWTFAGNNNYNSANGTVNNSIAKATQSITLTVPQSITVGSTGTATTSGGSGTGGVTYSAGTSTGCTVNATTGVITVTNANGTCAITATKAGDDNYEPATDGPKSITLVTPPSPPAPAPITRPTIQPVGDKTNQEGETVSVGVSGAGQDGEPISFGASGLPPGLSIDPATGVISGVLPDTAAGTYLVTITVTDPSGDQASTTFTWVVNEAGQGNLTGRVLTDVGSPVGNLGVVLLDAGGKQIRQTSTDSLGRYRFEALPIGNFTVVTPSLSNELARGQATVVAGQTTELDLILPGKARLTLTANPAAILGDGVTTSLLEAVLVLKEDGTPISGVPVQFTATAGSLSSGSAATSADGRARVTLTAPLIEGVTPRSEQVQVVVRDLERGIFAEATIVVTFLPASIQGVVIDAGTGKPVAGAQVSVNEDFNGDGIIDFSAQLTTGPDGTYTIVVPRGNWSYNVEILVPVTVGGQTVMLTQNHLTVVGQMQGVGERFSASKKIGGQLFVVGNADQGPQETSKVFTKGTGITAQILSQSGAPVDFEVKVNPDGTFEVENITEGQYTILFQVTAPTGEKLAGIRMNVTVNQDGELAVQTGLIDPYGIVTDSVTGKPVAGAQMKLMWANTPLNVSKGRLPDTLVSLPVLSDFDPNQNRVPQVTTASGAYAWMVWPDGDYYILAEKSGYAPYDSRVEKRTVAAKPGEDSYIADGIIHVGQSIVEYDLQMQPLSGDAGTPAQPTPISGQTPLLPKPERPAQGDHQRYIFGYPDNTFKPGRSISRAEVATIMARILNLPVGTPATAPFPDVATDKWYAGYIAATSKAGIMTGYPDGTFRPDAPITRAEVATVAVRLRALAPMTGTAFGDTAGHWAEGYLLSAKLEGLMKGYPDGSFLPGQQMSRAEFVTAVNRLLNRGPLLGRPAPKWPDVPASHWAYGDVEEASTDHKFEAAPGPSESWIEDLQ